MKFDVIVGNPPYQKTSDSKGVASQLLWNEFVEQSTKLLKLNGYLCMVHPSGWRGLGSKCQSVKTTLLSGQMNYLEIHDTNDGLKTFGAETQYDWYVWQKCIPSKSTKIRDQDGNIVTYKINEYPFIPNGMFDEIFSLVAKDDEQKVEVLYNSSYHTQREHISQTKTNTFKYPCVRFVSVEGEPDFFYSNIDNKGHFGIPKVIFSNGRITSANCVIDSIGEFGLTQFPIGIIDSIENLPKIANAMRTEKFRKMMARCINGQMPALNPKVLATFRKDFWKEFVNADGTPKA